MRQVKDYLCPSRYPENYEVQLQKIRQIIYECLKNYPNFEGIDFTDVSGGYICVRGFHKDIIGYTYGDFPHLKYDMSNADEVIEEFIEMWKKFDNKKDVEDFKRFIEAGDKWGFD